MSQAKRTNRDNFAVTLRLARERAGLTQRELGQLAGVNFSQISRYEQGAALPRPGMLIKLAEALRVPPDYLREGEDLVHAEIFDEGGERIPICFSSADMAKVRESASQHGRTVEEEIAELFSSGLRALNGELAQPDSPKHLAPINQKGIREEPQAPAKMDRWATPKLRPEPSQHPKPKKK